MTTETMQATHTPGPWVRDGTKVEGANRGHMHDIAFCAMPMGLKSREESIANARLIAAAPDLLAVAQELLNALIEAEDRLVEADCDVGLYEGALGRAEVAIARAKGQAS